MPEQTVFVRSDQDSFGREGISAIWIQTMNEPGGRNAVDEDALPWSNDDMGQPVDLDGALGEVAVTSVSRAASPNDMEATRWDGELSPPTVRAVRRRRGCEDRTHPARWQTAAEHYL
jgi:hypothetical protein